MAQHSDIVSRKSPESPGLLQDPHDFSLVLGGPLYALLRRAYLCGEALELLGRRRRSCSLRWPGGGTVMSDGVLREDIACCATSPRAPIPMDGDGWARA
jgi:hypothetical protein